MANYRCNEIKEEAYRLVEGKLQTLLGQSSEQEITDLRNQVVSILSEAITHYTSVAGQYNKEVQGSNKLDLENKIKDKLFLSFNNQFEVIKKLIVESFKVKIAEIESRPIEGIVTTLEDILTALFTDHMGRFDS